MHPALSIHELSKHYSSGVIALDRVSLEVPKGDFFALLGPNGAGKSTLISVLSSLVKKTSGKVLMQGVDIDQNFPLARRHLGVVPQEFNFNTFEKVEAIVVNQGGYYGLERKLARKNAERYLRQLNLWEKREQPARFLSGGMKRRLMIARALVHQPSLLVLDEPTAGVDIELRRSMWQFLQEVNSEGTTIILTTHYLEEAEQLCRNVAIINRGVLLENTSMQSLLATLHKETFVLDFLPDTVLPSHFEYFDIKLLGPQHVEFSVEKGQAINEVFAYLSGLGLQVSSMRNKVNRLEELFVERVQSSGAAL